MNKKISSAISDYYTNVVRKFTNSAKKLNTDFHGVWLILSSISNLKKSIEFLTLASEINPQSRQVRRGMRWSATRIRKEQHESECEETLSPIDRKGMRKFSNVWSKSSTANIIIIGSVLMFCLGLPSLQAQAFVQKASRPANALLKNTLTPTVISSPTQTPIPPPTLTPTPTATADTDYSSYYYHSWDIEEEVSGTNDFWVEVDLSAQKLFAYRGGQILNAFNVSTGTSSYPTVTGAFKMYAKYPTYTMVGPGYDLPDVPYSMFFYKGYSIHGTYWHNNFGTPMSHGCVNMNTDEAAWVYNQSTIGTYVFVHY